MTATASAPSVHAPRGLVALLATLSAIGPFAVDAYLPALTAIGADLHVSTLSVQQTLTAYMVPFALMSLWHGALADAWGRRVVILWGTALFLVASIACACSRTLDTLLLFRALQGMTAGAGMVAGRALIRDLYDGATAQRAMSHVSLMFALAPAIAPVVGGWVLTAFGWRGVFGFLVVFSAGAWLWCQRALPETLPPDKRQPLHPAYLMRAYTSVLGSRQFLLICAVITLMFSGFFIYVMSAPEFLMNHLGVPATGFLWLFGPATLGIAGGSYLSGRTAGKMSTTRTLAWAFGLMGLATAANLILHLARPPSLPWSVAPLLVYSLGMSLAFPVLTLRALDLFPEQRGLAASCQSFVQTLGAAANALLVPLIWHTTVSLAVTQAVLLGLALLGLLLPARRPSAQAS